jgi:hypothetical protein
VGVTACRRAEGAVQDSLGLHPISANLRRLGLYAEDLSRRDSVKVAQYEVLGNDAKRHVRPYKGRSKRWAFGGLARRSAIASIGRSSRPGRIALQER